jgi:hypothetical protein
MCSFKTLHRDETGHVVKCNGCGHYNLSFGNLQLAFTEDQFHEFARTIESYHKVYSAEEQSEVKCVRIPTPARGVTMLYSPSEIKQLSSLLQRVSSRLYKERLFVFNNN